MGLKITKRDKQDIERSVFLLGMAFNLSNPFPIRYSLIINSIYIDNDKLSCTSTSIATNVYVIVSISIYISILIITSILQCSIICENGDRRNIMRMGYLQNSFKNYIHWHHQNDDR